MNIRTPYMGSLQKGQVFTQPSQTVPDQSMSVKEIMDRYARGLPLGGSKVPFYEEEEDVDDLDPMPTYIDKIDAIEWARSNKKRIQSLQETLGSINEQQARSQAAEIKSKSLKTPPEA